MMPCLPPILLLHPLSLVARLLFLFFFNDTATTEIYTLSLHDALPISPPSCCRWRSSRSRADWAAGTSSTAASRDRKSTRLNSSHLGISYAVFCLKKKKQTKETEHTIYKNPHIHTTNAPHDTRLNTAHN